MKYKNASKITKKVKESDKVKILSPQEIFLITGSLLTSKKSLKNRIEFLGELISEETKLMMYNDLYQISALINKIS